jgi:putative transcriptional regulator
MRTVIALLFLVTAGVLPADAETDLLPPPRKGVLLIASPTLNDPNFFETVVLLCEHGDAGSLGIILNRPTSVPIGEALRDLPGATHATSSLFLGGPVQPGAVLALVRGREASADLLRVLEGVYLVGNAEALAHVLARPDAGEAVRVFAGYAGWGPGQLEFEIEQGAWATMSTDAATVFTKSPARLWSDLIERLKRPRIIRHEPAVVPLS